MTDEVASTVRPVKQLRAFTRVSIPAGESRRVSFPLDEKAFALWDNRMQRVVEPGEFLISVGASSEDIRLQGKLTL